MTPSIQPSPLPADALLRKYQQGIGYADCYVAEVPGKVSLADFIEAFYTTRLFKIERTLLRWLAARPATDADARALAAGGVDTFSAWRVEDRSAYQLLLADLLGKRTRSWLMAQPVNGAARPATRLHFGSAVVPLVKRKTGEQRMGWGFHALGGFHRLYSRLLLRAACRRLVG